MSLVTGYRLEHSSALSFMSPDFLDFFTLLGLLFTRSCDLGLSRFIFRHGKLLFADDNHDTYTLELHQVELYLIQTAGFY